MDHQHLFIEMALKNWQLQLDRAEKTFSSLSDEELLNDIVPGKNRAIYLLGHFIAYHDMMAETLGIGERHYRHLDDAFIKNPDKSGFEIPDTATLRENWKDVHQKLNDYFSALSPEEWFKKHNAVSEEDFAKEPYRNRLNLLMNRTAHIAYHVGQLKLK
jgi:hypothetical protein